MRTRAKGGSGLIPDERASPPKLAFAVTLYRTDPLFHALVDLALIGCVTFVFFLLKLLPGVSPSAQNHAAADSGSSSALQRPVGSGRTDVRPISPLLTLDDNPVGQATLESLESITLSKAFIASSPPAVAAVLAQVAPLIGSGQAEDALAALEKLDPSEPTVALAQAIATLHRPGPGRSIEALKRLRTATAKGSPAAFTLTGVILIRLVVLNDRGRLPASELVTLDGANNTLPATRIEIATEAVQWWERAAAFQNPAAMRFLGMIEARGIIGRKSIAGAVAHWQNAARRGDPVARTELGELHLHGVGVEADPVKAAGYFRDAATQGVVRANIGLGVAMLTPAIKGDREAAHEGIAALETAIRTTHKPEFAALAHMTLGAYFNDVVAGDQRSPSRAVAHWLAATTLGARNASMLVIRALRTGVGIEQDKAMAYALLRDLANSNPAYEPERVKLEQELTPTDVTRANTIDWRQFKMPKFAMDELGRARLLSRRSGADGLFGSALDAQGGAASRQRLFGAIEITKGRP